MDIAPLVAFSTTARHITWNSQTITDASVCTFTHFCHHAHALFFSFRVCSSLELRELEARLKAGYMNKERAAQIAEKKALKTKDEVTQKVGCYGLWEANDRSLHQLIKSC